jgi:hypothetical protein
LAIVNGCVKSELLFEDCRGEDALSRKYAHLSIIINGMQTEWTNSQARSVQERSTVESVSIIQWGEQANQIYIERALEFSMRRLIY